MTQVEKSKGYIIVASHNHNFYVQAVYLAETILDYYPEAKITLVTEERFMDDRTEIFDKVIPCDDNYRAKLYGMTQTPYDVTFYIDADTFCEHEDISTIFDLLEDNDLMFTPLNKENEYVFKSRYFNPEEPNEYRSMKLCGGVCLYDTTNPLVKDFIQDWWDYYNLQRSGEWWPLDENGEKDFKNFNWENRFWDQFTLWRLTNEVDKYKDLKIGHLDLRWNYYHKFLPDKTPLNNGPVVIRHFSSGVMKWEGSYKDGDLKV